jgi:hypothetical protein
LQEPVINKGTHFVVATLARLVVHAKRALQEALIGLDGVDHGCLRKGVHHAPEVFLAVCEVAASPHWTLLAHLVVLAERGLVSVVRVTLHNDF